MARPKSDETKAKEAEIAALPTVDLVEALAKFMDVSILNIPEGSTSEDHAPYVRGAQIALTNFIETLYEYRNKFDAALSARRVSDPEFLPKVERFRKERDNSPKAAKPSALQMLGIGVNAETPE